jgi:hypothetical protein
MFTGLNSILYKFNVHDQTYRVFQEERSIFFEVIVSVIVRKKIHMNVSNSELLPR